MSEPRVVHDAGPTIWEGCYNNNWQGVIVPDAFAHPAKFARGLIRRIYQHMLDSGYIAAGDSVVDPFGGVGLGGLDAMTFGLHYTGCELEDRFVTLGNQNIDKWRRDLAMLADRLGTARLLQGDSRQLLAVVGAGAAAAVSSPPFGDQLPSHDDFQPPHDSTARLGVNYETAYGNSPGQLGTMPPGDYAAAVSSPPYGGDALGHDAGCIRLDANEDARRAAEGSYRRPGYGATNDNIGNVTGDTFWAAARQIVGQTYAALRPGGVAVWVCKDYVRAGQRVPFSDQWQALCEAAGFTPLERIQAMLVEDHGEQQDIFGGATRKRKQRKSFFRLLAEKKGAPPIDHEDVIIVRKPQ